MYRLSRSRLRMWIKGFHSKSHCTVDGRSLGKKSTPETKNSNLDVTAQSGRQTGRIAKSAQFMNPTAIPAPSASARASTIPHRSTSPGTPVDQATLPPRLRATLKARVVPIAKRAKIASGQ